MHKRCGDAIAKAHDRRRYAFGPSAERVKRLRTRLFVLVLLAVLPAMGAIIYSGYRDQHVAYARARQQAETLAQTVAASFRRANRETALLVATLAQVPAVRSGTTAECDSFIRRILKRNASLGNIGVIDRRGDLVCSAVHFKGTVYLGDRSYYKKARALHQNVVGTFQIGRVVHVPLIVFAAPLAAGTRADREVVYASLSLIWLNKLVTATHLPKGSTLTVLDAGHRVIAHYPQPQKWLGKRIPVLTRLVQGLHSSESAITSERGVGDTNQLFSVFTLRGMEGEPASYVIVGIPESQILGSGMKAMLASLATLGLVTLLLLSIGWWGSRKLILRRLDTLVYAAELLGKGVLSARSRLQGRDELARLGSTFDTMAESLEAHSRSLENQVTRVDRLNRTYRVLSGINGVILRVRDRETLLQEACRIAVELGGHSMAWIGLVSPEADRVQLAAHAGNCREMIEALYVSADASRPEGGGTVGSALRTLKPCVVNDIASDPRMTPWREELLANDCKAVATFPLFIQDRVIGNFTVYSTQVGYFDEEDIHLFEEVASDTALGLELIETSEQRDYLANHDPVTGLENHQRFLANLEQTLRVLPEGSPPPWVLAVEIPELRRIKNHFGHHVTDEIMRKFIPGLKAILEEPDSLAVLSGGGFGIALLQADDSRRDVRSVADRIVALCPCEMEVDGHQHLLTVRIGAARADADISVDILVRNAEVALHALDASPDKQFQTYSRQHDARETRRYQVRQGLRRALARNDFEVVYQPYLDMRSGRQAGAEALLRWNSEELGPVSPGEFIPVAEENGLIGDIGAWIFQRVLRQIKTWQDEGFDPGTVSVNVSATELQQPGVTKLIQSYLASSGVDLCRSPVALELTETAVVQDFEHVSSILEDIRQLGIRIYLDDYGTGYSSLLYLQRTPLDVLKIDLSFIRRIVEDPTSLALTRSSISLAHSLDLQVIAEGVENEEQLAILRELGCDIAQGFLYSRPLPSGEVRRFVAEHGEAKHGKKPDG